MSDCFYITTTLPYVNAKPHIGFGLEIVAADVIARFQKKLGKEVVFNTGTDEHGQKIYQASQAEGLDPQNYVDKYAKEFEKLKNLLDLDYTHFTRTTNPNHRLAAQKFWQVAKQNGDIYKDSYETSYCVGCELEKQASELDESGRCPLHPTKPIEKRQEENYFFRFSRYQEPLLELYRKQPDFVKPTSKWREIVAFVESGLKDFSISRLKSKMPWGVEVPDDPQHVMYVWFDALVNYISALGWPNQDDLFKRFWPVTQIAGKDNLRQQAAMWQAMLMSVGLEPSRQVLINGFISIDGQKMSKSLGNVIEPQDMVDRFGRDATRYLLMSLGPVGGDIDLNWDQLDTLYTAKLTNGLGNLCSRVAKLCQKTNYPFNHEVIQTHELDRAYQDKMSQYKLGETLELLDTQVAKLDRYLATTKPWQAEDKKAHDILRPVVDDILQIANKMIPFMPTSAQQIIDHFSQTPIQALPGLFPRIKLDEK